MLLAALILLPHVALSKGRSLKEMRQHPYGREPPANGRLIHDMRDFINVTFDWSSRNYDGHGKFVIPQCHERRLRRTFYEHPKYMLGIALNGVFGVKTGHLVYPFVVTVSNGTLPQREFFAAGVHKIFSNADYSQISHLWPYSPLYSPLNPENLKINLIELVLISENVWRGIWDIWSAPKTAGKNLCNGGRYFDSILPKIYRDSEIKPQYNDLVPNYTDIISDVCGTVRCGDTHNQTETFILGLPTKEGIDHLVNLPYFKGYSAEKSIGNIRYTNLNRVRSCVIDHYRKKEDGDYFEAEVDAQTDMFATKCIFYPPYC